VVVYDKDEMASASSAEKISKSNVIKVIYLEGGIQSWIENNLPLVEKT
jgi:rhodanese-related sulfurtransferase